MTDAPEGPAEGEPERGARRSPRVGDSGAPVGSTLSIVLAVVAVIAGFLILRELTDDDGGAATEDPTTQTDVGGSVVPPGSLVPVNTATTLPAATVPKTAATVMVANASGVQGSALTMSTALTTAGYTLAEPGNSTGAQLTETVVHYVAGDANAQAVAAMVAAELGGKATSEMPAPPPVKDGIGAATVVVMLGTDTAGKTLAELNPAGAVTPPAAAGVTTTAAG